MAIVSGNQINFLHILDKEKREKVKKIALCFSLFRKQASRTSISFQYYQICRETIYTESNTSFYCSI